MCLHYGLWYNICVKLAKNYMARQKRKKRQYRCSVCRKNGHTKRECNLREQAVQREKKKGPIPVFVHAKKDGDASSHIVNLKGNVQQPDWKEIEVFREKIKAQTQRVSVDWAQMIREANEKERLKQVHAQRQPRVVPKIAPVTPKPIGQPKPSKHIRPKKKQRVRLSLPTLEFQFSIFSRQRMGAFAFVLILLVALPYPAFAYFDRLRHDTSRAVEASTSAFFALQSSTLAALHSDIGNAQQDLSTALQHFSQARSIVDKEHSMLVYVARLLPVIGKQVEGRQQVLVAGHHLALGNTYLLKGLGEVQAASEEQATTDQLLILKAHMRSAIVQYQEALDQLEDVDNSAIPIAYQQSFTEFRSLFATLIDDMNDLNGLIDVLYSVFGGEDFKRYLVLFQNHHERRATGGFIGSFATIDVQKGKILDINIPGGGSYDVQGQLSEYVEPPLPLQLVNKRWEFQDANWFFDFPTTASKAEWFLEHSWGMSFDGVIAVNGSVVERLLRVLGPVEHDEYDLLLEADTALASLQGSVKDRHEEGYTDPKGVLTGILDQLLSATSELDNVQMLKVLGEMHEALLEKEIQIAVEDPAVQTKLKEFHWTGEVIPTNVGKDYLAVVHTNIAGSKTDVAITEEINHDVAIDEDGMAIVRVTINRTHTGTEGERFYGEPNIDYVRVYVPAGSELLDAGGFDYPPEDAFLVPESWYTSDTHLAAIEKENGYHISTGTRVTSEFGKTAFGNWVITRPGEKSSIYFEYRLPFTLFDQLQEAPRSNTQQWKELFTPKQKEISTYQLFVQKQSGASPFVQSTITYPSDWKPIHSTHIDTGLGLHTAQISGELETDRSIGIVMEREK